MTLYRQADDCAFWVVEYEHGAMERRPIDDHAVYATTDRGLQDRDVPVRTASRDLLTAIRTIGARHNLKNHPKDRVRVNGGSWMDVADYSETDGWIDEGFIARYENGSVLYAVKANDSRGKVGPPTPMMRRWDDHSSEGVVNSLEVDWGQVDSERGTT